MRVRMKHRITGTRNGDAWPDVGGELDVPEDEARSLEANGYATIVQRAEDEQGAAGAESGDVELAALRVPELRQLAKDRGVDLGDATRKDDIIAALELAADTEDTDAAPAGDT